MGKLANVVLGAIATVLIAIGIAAQTGSIHMPNLGSPRGGVSGAQAQQSPTSQPTPSPDLTPTPTDTPVVADAPPPVLSGGHGKKHKH